MLATFALTFACELFHFFKLYMSFGDVQNFFLRWFVDNDKKMNGSDYNIIWWNDIMWRSQTVYPQLHKYDWGKKYRIITMKIRTGGVMK